jgi:hypothetical protein
MEKFSGVYYPWLKKGKSNNRSPLKERSIIFSSLKKIISNMVFFHIAKRD